mgnify:CR=1 FL=1
MAKSLVIVESPAKAKKIGGILGSDYVVESSVGHIRDLPANAAEVPAEHKGKPWASMGVDTENDFEPVYVINPDKKKTVSTLRKLMKDADELVLATDKDREGEAIAWHLLEILKPKVPVKRMVFGEITKQAIEEAIANTIDLDDRLVDAQEARRILDRLYGYELSPVLWKKVNPGLSAGRVQSVATRVIVERERERMAFVSADYWDLAAKLRKPDAADAVAGNAPFDSTMVALDGKKLASGRDFAQDGTMTSREVERLDQVRAEALADGLDGADFTVASVETKPYRRKPPAPFSTSTLQQEAARKLGYSASHTMRLAQSLYEAGAITYMRTDGVQMDMSAIMAARDAIVERFSDDYRPEKPRFYSTKAKNAQEAHEAIRPTDFRKDRAGSGDEAKLYDLIFKRAMASQMATAQLERTTVTLRDATGRHELRATGQVVKFPGYFAVYQEGFDDKAEDEDEGLLPVLRKGDAPAKTAVEANQHFTQPPPRFSEASLVKRLEELGIGRPSTYASTIQTLRDREYVRMEKNRFFAEESGRLLTAFLERFFPNYVAYDFTAGMEDDLDEVSAGNEAWKTLL